MKSTITQNFLQNIYPHLWDNFWELILKNQERNFTKLNETIKYLQDKYKLKVQFITKYLSAKNETNGWNNNTIGLNIENKESLGCLFMLSHIFWHLVQYSSWKDYSNLMKHLQWEKPLYLTDNFKKEYFLFEKEWFEIGKWLLEEIDLFNQNIPESLYDAFMYADYEHYWNFLTTWNIWSALDFYKKWEKFLSSNNNSLIQSIKTNIEINDIITGKLKIKVV